MRPKTLLLLLTTAVIVTGSVPAQTGSAPSLTVYPSFHVKFMHEGKSYLLASTILVNVSDKTMRNLTLTQVFPDELVPEPAPAGIHEYFARPEGFEDSIEGQTYRMKTPLLRRGEITSALAVLRYDGRPSSAEIPPAKIEYAAAGESYTETGPPLELQLKKYSKYSGDLSDFLKRYAGVILSFPSKEGPDWGFSGFAYRVRGKTPLGMVEVEGDREEGRFSLIRGAPGETRLLMMSWKPTSKARPATSEKEVLDIVKRQIMPSSDLDMDPATAEVTRADLGRNEAWQITGRWKDKVLARLGEGPVRWYVYNDRTRDRQYVLMLAAQGRGAGPENFSTPNPEKEAELMEELEEIAQSFRPL